MGSEEFERGTYSLTRSGEYFDRRLLQSMTGQPVKNFAIVVLTELFGNSLDAVEKLKRRPDILVRVRRRKKTAILSVRDNGDGIPQSLVEKILDFRTLTSDKAVYRSPTRGAQGNAMKTVLGIPYALGVRCPVLITSQGIQHRITASIDPAGEPQIDHVTKEVPYKRGTTVTLALPLRLCNTKRLRREVRAFALFNPHARVRIRVFRKPVEHAQRDGTEIAKSYPRVRKPISGEAVERAQRVGKEVLDSYPPVVKFPGDEWNKYLPGFKTSAHWYDGSAFKRLCFAQLTQPGAKGRDRPFRDFLTDFRGLSGKLKLARLTRRFPQFKVLADFRKHQADLDDLLLHMQSETKPPTELTALGMVDEESFRLRLAEWYGIKRHWYRRLPFTIEGIPYVAEAIVAEVERGGGDLFCGVNFAPTFSDPLSDIAISGGEVAAHGVRGYLTQAHVLPEQHFGCSRAGRFIAAFHLTSPSLEFKDKGKTHLEVSEEVARKIGKVLWLASKEVYQETEERKKDAAKAEKKKEDRQRKAAITEKRMDLNKCVPLVALEAYEKGTDGGKSRLSVRDFYYEVRPLLARFDYVPDELKWGYFQQLVPIMRRSPDAPPMPMLYYKARGILYEPHTGREIPIGTREVEVYDFPLWRFNKILYIEKQGVWEAMKDTGIAERHDMAVIAAEGYATEAMRVLLSRAQQEQEYTIYVWTDADPYGYNIARTLSEETARMPGYHVEIKRVGFFLEEVLTLGLQSEEFTRAEAIPQGLKLSAKEMEYFEGRKVDRDEQEKLTERKRKPKEQWRCRRVEINAMRVADRPAYLENQLVKAGITGKVIPPVEEIRDVYVSTVNSDIADRVRERHEEQILAEVEEATAKAEEAVEEVKNEDLEKQVRNYLKDRPEKDWRSAAKDIANRFARELLDDEGDES